jgi:hypothetical protein
VRTLTIALSVLALLALAPAPARAAAGTYDVTTCATTGPGGVNNAWKEGVVGRVDFQPPLPADDATYDFSDNCALAGVVLRSGASQAVGDWGTDQTMDFTAPAGTQITRLVLWRESHVQQTNSGGRWSLVSRSGDGAALGGPFGPDQCVPGEGFFPNPCDKGASGFGESTISRYDLATDRLQLGLSCGTPSGSGIAGCDTGGTASPLAYFRIKASVVTIRDDIAPSITAAGSLLDPGWRRGDADVTYDATDSTGIRRAVLLLDGQERGRDELACDYTFPAPCANATGRRLTLGDAPLADGFHQVQILAEDAAGNPASITRTVTIDAHPPNVSLTRAGGKTITLAVADSASGVASGTISVRNSVDEPFRALPTTLANGRLTAKLDRGSAARVGIRVSVSDNAGNVTDGELSEMSLRVGRHAPRGGGVSIAYGRAATVGGQITTRDGQPVGGQAVAVQQTLRAPGAVPTVAGNVATDARGRFSYRAPAGPSRQLRFVFAGSPGLAPLARVAQLRVRASSTIHASRRTLNGGGRVRFSGRLGLRGATVPRSGKLVDLQAFDGGRWRTFATARARGSKGAWAFTYRFAGRPGRYPIRLRIRREDVFPYDLGYSRSVVVRVR